MPPGTRLEETDRVLQRIEAVVADRQRYPEVRDQQSTAGSLALGNMGGGLSGGQYGMCSVTLLKKRQRKRSDRQIMYQLRQDLATIPSATIRVTVAASMGGGEAPIELQLLGADLDQMNETADTIVRKLKSLPGFVYAERSTKPGRPELHVAVDRARAADAGITAAEVAGAVRASIEGDTTGKFTEKGKEYDIRVRLASVDRDNADDVRNVFLGLSNHGSPLRVADVGDVTESSGPSRIERQSRIRLVTVSSYLQEGLPLRDAQLQVEKIAQQLVPRGVVWQWGGDVKYFLESFRYMFEALLLAAVLVFLIQAALYNAVLEPLNVWFTMPMAVVGAAVALLLCHFTMSIVSMIGIIMLLGLVGKNAILMVDYTNTLRARGMTRREAILLAGPTRMRPILMTTIACIVGMLPTALALAEGSEWRAPMAVAVIGGLILSTILTLIMVPSMYTVIDDIAWFVVRMWYKVYLKREADPDMRWKRKV
jgi:HAE1 family hydrophobic/amphiphilic exporter-1